MSARQFRYVRDLPFFFFFFFSSCSSHLLSSTFLLSLPPNSRNSDPVSHSRLFSPPHHYGSILALSSREHFQLSFLVDSRRIVFAPTIFLPVDILFNHITLKFQVLRFFSRFQRTSWDAGVCVLWLSYGMAWQESTLCTTAVYLV